MGKRAKGLAVLFAAWLLIVPFGFIYTMKHFAPQEIDPFRLALYICLAILATILAVKFNGKPISLTTWVTMSVFLEYGLFYEMLIMQLSLFVILFTQRNNTGVVKRFAVNSTMLFVASILSAAAFYLAGGKIGNHNFWLVIFTMTVYRLVQTFINLMYLKVYFKLSGSQHSYSIRDDAFEYASIILLLPMSLTLYFLLDTIGNSAFALIGIPYAVTVLIIRSYSRSERVNSELKEAGVIGNELAGLSDEQEIHDELLERTSKLFHADYAYLYKNEDGWLERCRGYELGKFIDSRFGPFTPGEEISRMVVKEKRAILFNNRQEWGKVSLPGAQAEVESILCIPIEQNAEVAFVLLLGAKRRNAFKEYQLKILDMLSSYFIVSLTKASLMKDAIMKSEKCALTKLYNYKFLEERLVSEMEKVLEGHTDTLSVVMLDIDHFKKVNDSYGHQSGNDILASFAKLLEKALPEGATVGRYGGEEFLFLLPGFTKDKALDFAEKMRKLIRRTPFSILPDLDGQLKQIDAYITSSIGVSTAPDDTDEAMTLLRNADRALYIGAKQAGRDRVAEYIR